MNNIHTLTPSECLLSCFLISYRPKIHNEIRITHGKSRPIEHLLRLQQADIDVTVVNSNVVIFIVVVIAFVVAIVAIPITIIRRLQPHKLSSHRRAQRQNNQPVRLATSVTAVSVIAPAVRQTNSQHNRAHIGVMRQRRPLPEPGMNAAKLASMHNNVGQIAEARRHCGRRRRWHRLAQLVLDERSVVDVAQYAVRQAQKTGGHNAERMDFRPAQAGGRRWRLVRRRLGAHEAGRVQVGEMADWRCGSEGMD